MIEFKKIIISQYRAIEKAEINLNNSISPIIGVNEAGKTTVLKAILCLDKRKDKLNRGEHLECKNLYNMKNNAVISAYLSIKDQDFFANLIEQCKVNTSSDDYKILEKLSIAEEFILSRDLSNANKLYQLENSNLENLTSDIKQKVTKIFVTSIPYILYFDDFNDRVPTEIKFSDTYLEKGKLNQKNSEWHEIIEEIFKRSEQEFIDKDSQKTALQQYLETFDRGMKRGILSDIYDRLNRDIIDEWKRIKQAGFDGKQEFDIAIALNNQDGTKDFKFDIIDRSNKKGRYFSVAERSKGFQWFFNYMIKLKFNPNYKDNIENCLFLLDEPGSYLHSSAQSELLNELNKVSEKNKIIFCTHSQFLLNPDIISLGSIKIAENENAEIKISNYGDYSSIAGNKTGALSPVHEALRINPVYDFIGAVVIFEGITDYCFWKLLQKNKQIPDDIKLIPGSGAGNLSLLISIAIGFSTNFAIILDDDKAGKKAKAKYIKEFGDGIEKHIHFYFKPTLEKLMTKYVRDKLLQITESNTVKKALGMIMFSEKWKDFVDAFDEQTKSNIATTLDDISNLKKDQH